MKKTLELWGKDGTLLMVLSLMMMLFCIFYKEDPVLATKPKAIRTTIVTSGLVEQKEETWQGVVTRWEEAVEEARLREELLARVSSIVNNYTSNETTQSYIYYAWEQFVYYGWSEYDYNHSRRAKWPRTVQTIGTTDIRRSGGDLTTLRKDMEVPQMR